MRRVTLTKDWPIGTYLQAPETRRSSVFEAFAFHERGVSAHGTVVSDGCVLTSSDVPLANWVNVLKSPDLITWVAVLHEMPEDAESIGLHRINLLRTLKKHDIGYVLLPHITWDDKNEAKRHTINMNALVKRARVAAEACIGGRIRWKEHYNKYHQVKEELARYCATFTIEEPVILTPEEQDALTVACIAHRLTGV